MLKHFLTVMQTHFDLTNRDQLLNCGCFWFLHMYSPLPNSPNAETHYTNSKHRFLPKYRDTYVKQSMRFHNSLFSNTILMQDVGSNRRMNLYNLVMQTNCLANCYTVEYNSLNRFALVGTGSTFSKTEFGLPYNQLWC